MNKREAHMQTVFKHYLQECWDGGSAAFELKRTTTNQIPVSEIQEHQRSALKNAYERMTYYKIPDDSIKHKPFDCFVLQQSLAYVVIAFGKRLTAFHIIPIWVWESKTKHKKTVSKSEVEKWEDVEVVPIGKRS